MFYFLNSNFIIYCLSQTASLHNQNPKVCSTAPQGSIAQTGGLLDEDTRDKLKALKFLFNLYSIKRAFKKVWSLILAYLNNSQKNIYNTSKFANTAAICSYSIWVSCMKGGTINSFLTLNDFLTEGACLLYEDYHEALNQ